MSSDRRAPNGAAPTAAAAGLSALPAYIPRAHDAALAAVVDEVQARGRSRMVVLVGGSSTGKTRACWEAIRSLPAPWRLWHPIDPGWAQATLAGLEEVKPYTVAGESSGNLRAGSGPVWRGHSTRRPPGSGDPVESITSADADQSAARW
ncbi:hypothetical protein [Streptosporangium sp. CA-115845]|uniref:hypothetical protein n=1 Tax=Streptosporangium sp. CA-115845 TaxID=3240071 RepID=UPI003D8FE2ED